MKQCIDCKLTKDATEYGKHATTADRLMQRCKACQSAYNKCYRDMNRDRLNTEDRRRAAEQAELRAVRTREWIKANPERRKQTLELNYQRHKEAGTLDKYYGKRDPKVARQRAKQWRLDNPGKVAATTAKRRDVVRRATVPWTEWEEIEKVYIECARISEETGVKHQVDHKIPLVNAEVCGLHCLANLQIITAVENNIKKCKFVD
jgi:hypothetical protein